MVKMYYLLYELLCILHMGRKGSGEYVWMLEKVLLEQIDLWD